MKLLKTALITTLACTLATISPQVLDDSYGVDENGFRHKLSGN